MSTKQFENILRENNQDGRFDKFLPKQNTMMSTQALYFLVIAIAGFFFNAA